MCLGSLFVAPGFLNATPLASVCSDRTGVGITGIAILFVVPWVSQLYTAHAGRGSAWNSFYAASWRRSACCHDSADGRDTAGDGALDRNHARRSSGLDFFTAETSRRCPGCLFAGSIVLRVHNMATATYVAAAINLVRGRVRCLWPRERIDSSCGGARQRLRCWRRRGAGIGGANTRSAGMVMGRKSGT